jgi:hypothetical protein
MDDSSSAAPPFGEGLYNLTTLLDYRDCFRDASHVEATHVNRVLAMSGLQCPLCPPTARVVPRWGDEGVGPQPPCPPPGMIAVREYLCRWGGSPLNDSWETGASIQGARFLNRRLHGVHKVRHFEAVVAEDEARRQSACIERSGVLLDERACARYAFEAQSADWVTPTRIIGFRSSLSDTSCERVVDADTVPSAGAPRALPARAFLVTWASEPFAAATWEPAEWAEAHMAAAVRAYRMRVAPPCALSPAAPEPAWDAAQVGPGWLPPWLSGGRRLRDDQAKGVAFVLSAFARQRGALLADQPGMGKRVVALSVLSCLHAGGGRAQDEKKGLFLVVAPFSKLSRWARDLAAWAPQLRALAYHGRTHDRELMRETMELKATGAGVCSLVDVVITTPEMFMADCEFLCHVSWQALIVDEAERLRTPASKLYVTLMSLAVPTPLVLTSTPIVSIAELFALLHFIDARAFSDEVAFAGNFDDPRVQSGASRRLLFESPMCDAPPASSRGPLSEALQGILLRRTMEEVAWPQLSVVVPCPLAPQQRAAYREILAQASMKPTWSHSEAQAAEARAGLEHTLQQLKECCNHASFHSRPGAGLDADAASLSAGSGKLRVLDQLLPFLKGRGLRVLMLSYQPSMISLLSLYLRARGHAFDGVDGSMTTEERRRRVGGFTAPGNCFTFAFLLSARAACEGESLISSADAVIFIDHAWGPQMTLNGCMQGALASRVGPARPLTVLRLVTAETVEDTFFRGAQQASVEEAAARAAPLLCPPLLKRAKPLKGSRELRNLAARGGACVADSAAGKEGRMALSDAAAAAIDAVGLFVRDLFFGFEEGLAAPHLFSSEAAAPGESAALQTAASDGMGESECDDAVRAAIASAFVELDQRHPTAASGGT